MIFCIIIFVFILLLIVCVPFRLTLEHPILFIKYLCSDVFLYFKYKKWHNISMGKFQCYDASFGTVFGSGKTLSVVHQVLNDYKKYNNKKIYDSNQNKWVVQKVKILSNLNFKSVPYEHLVNLGQIVQIAERCKDEDKKNNTFTAIIVVIDECQNQLHSRTFKDNLSPLLLKTLTECRHYNLSIYYDAPRFGQVDALMRQCTSLNIKCKKLWRFQIQSVYDAYDMENASNVTMVKPLKMTGFFITNELFSAYDTKEIIENLIKAKERNDFLTDEEILSLQCNDEFRNDDAIMRPSKTLKRRRKK